jgi:hypothetical protein
MRVSKSQSWKGGKVPSRFLACCETCARTIRCSGSSRSMIWRKISSGREGKVRQGVSGADSIVGEYSPCVL